MASKELHILLGAGLTASNNSIACLLQHLDRSAGVFGFPASAASQIAVDSVNKWINQRPDRFDTIVFNVFSDRDQWLYTERLSRQHHE